MFFIFFLILYIMLYCSIIFIISYNCYCLWAQQVNLVNRFVLIQAVAVIKGDKRIALLLRPLFYKLEWYILLLYFLLGQRATLKCAIYRNLFLIKYKKNWFLNKCFKMISSHALFLVCYFKMSRGAGNLILSPHSVERKTAIEYKKPYTNK